MSPDPHITGLREEVDKQQREAARLAASPTPRTPEEWRDPALYVVRLEHELAAAKEIESMRDQEIAGLQERHGLTLIKLDKAEAELAALREDSGRIDLIEQLWKEDNAPYFYPEDGTWRIWLGDGLHESKFPSLRAALDAAKGAEMSDTTEYDQTGGPAFPTRVTQPFGDGWLCVGGMTLLDWFAATARQEDFFVPVTVDECAKMLGVETSEYNGSRDWGKVISRSRYDYAVAMLAEKRRREGKP